MIAPEPGPHATPTQAKEWGAAQALLPIAATLGFYALPPSLQEQTLVQFAPQIVAYLALGLWAAHNRDIVSRLGLEKRKSPGWSTLGTPDRPASRLPEYVRDSLGLSTSGL